MAIINVRRVRDAFVRAEVTDEAKGLELATSLDEEMSETVVSQERLETRSRESTPDSTGSTLGLKGSTPGSRVWRRDLTQDLRRPRPTQNGAPIVTRRSSLAALFAAVSVMGILFAFL